MRSFVLLSLAIPQIVGLTGCSMFRQVGLAFDALLFRTESDYDALEEHRDEAIADSGAKIDARRFEGAQPKEALWPGFRGQHRDGRCADTTILTDWPESGPPELWRQPIGGGYSSFAVAHGLAFTMEQRREQEAVTAYDLATGQQVWIHLYDAFFTATMVGEGPRATPSYHDGRLYTLGTTGELHCLEARTGAVLWRRNVLEDGNAKNIDYGLSASPLVAGDRVVVLSGEPEEERGVIAYERTTGEILWTALSDVQAYASPIEIELAGREQILVCTADRVVGLEPSTGALLWEYPWRIFNGLTCSQPIAVGENRVVLSGSYGKGAAMIEIPTGDPPLDVKEIWQSTKLRNKFNSSVLHEGFLYGLDEGILVCMDASTGERKWKGGRYGYGQVLIVRDHLIVLGGDGDLVLVRATPERLDERVRITAFDGNTWTPPALVGGLLLIRNAAEMICYDLRVGS